MKQAPRYRLEHVQLETLEAAIYARRHDEAAALLMEAFRRLRTGSEFVGLPYLQEGVRPKYFARLAAALTSLLLDPGFNFSEEGYEKILIERGVIDAVFEASAFESSDHLARLLSDTPAERDVSKLNYSAENLAKWLLVQGLGSGIDVDYDQLFGRSPAVAAMFLPLWAAMIGSGVVLTQAAHERRESLLKLRHYFQNLDVPNAAAAPLSDAFMNASYCVASDKHELKFTLARMMERTLQKKLVSVLPTKTQLAVRRAEIIADWLQYRPTMVIPLEHFGSFHAMYRCYAPIVRQLRQRFFLVAITRASALDETSRQEFDKTLTIPDGAMELSTIIEQVNSASPDIIWYPSIGMAVQWVNLACVRLAPIQVMTLGHPATSMSPAMDYCVAEESVVSSAELFSERVLVVPEGSMAFERRPDLPPRRIRTQKDFENKMDVDIAVSAMVLKLNYQYLQTLKEISYKCLNLGTKSCAVRYHFFPATLGVAYWQALRHLRATFPNCAVHPRCDYPQYMELLGACDLSLCPFPFGGTNSSVDSLWLGLPTVMLMGDQPHSRSDAQALLRAGSPMMITHSEEEYCALAVELACNSRTRWGFYDHLTNFNLGTRFFGDPHGDAAGAYGRAFWHLFANHERLQADSERRLITWEEFS